MPATTADDDRQHREKLRKEYTRRKRLLEIRKARQGDSADPALDIELEEINASLALLELADEPKASPEVQAAVGHEHINQLVIAQVAKVVERLTRTEEGLQDVIASQAMAQEIAREWREMIAHEIAEMKTSVDHVYTDVVTERLDRVSGQRWNFWLNIASVAIVLFLAALLLWILR